MTARHCPSGENDDVGGDDVSLWAAVAEGKEYSEDAGTEPNDAQAGILKVFVRPM